MHARKTHSTTLQDIYNHVWTSKNTHNFFCWKKHTSLIWRDITPQASIGTVCRFYLYKTINTIKPPSNHINTLVLHVPIIPQQWKSLLQLIWRGFTPLASIGTVCRLHLYNNSTQSNPPSYYINTLKGASHHEQCHTMQLCVWTVDALITLKLKKKNPLIFVGHSIF